MSVEHSFTSTGIKFLLHPEQLTSYYKGEGRTVISTHVAPEGNCNLKCHYCSVKRTRTRSRIPLSVIVDYLNKLIDRGLKAVILTGGGEPLMYPYINELVDYIQMRGLECGLITNGTMSERLSEWSTFSWVRISVNQFDGWLSRIRIPVDKLKEECTVGLSFIYSYEAYGEILKTAVLADKLGAEYIRLLPNCLMKTQDFEFAHIKLQQFMGRSIDQRFFHQRKGWRVPRSKVCHQSFFRPFLSELASGLVFPCDSVVLNNRAARFRSKFAVCEPHQILDYLDGKIEPKFDPRKDCDRCVFTNTVEMLGEVKNGVKHVHFV